MTIPSAYTSFIQHTHTQYTHTHQIYDAYLLYFFFLINFNDIFPHSHHRHSGCLLIFVGIQCVWATFTCVPTSIYTTPHPPFFVRRYFQLNRQEHHQPLPLSRTHDKCPSSYSRFHIYDIPLFAKACVFLSPRVSGGRQCTCAYRLSWYIRLLVALASSGFIFNSTKWTQLTCVYVAKHEMPPWILFSHARSLFSIWPCFGTSERIHYGDGWHCEHNKKTRNEWLCGVDECALIFSSFPSHFLLLSFLCSHRNGPRCGNLRCCCCFGAHKTYIRYRNKWIVTQFPIFSARIWTQHSTAVVDCDEVKWEMVEGADEPATIEGCYISSQHTHKYYCVIKCRLAAGVERIHCELLYMQQRIILMALHRIRIRW